MSEHLYQRKVREGRRRNVLSTQLFTITPTTWDYTQHAWKYAKAALISDVTNVLHVQLFTGHSNIVFLTRGHHLWPMKWVNTRNNIYFFISQLTFGSTSSESRRVTEYKVSVHMRYVCMKNIVVMNYQWQKEKFILIKKKEIKNKQIKWK